MKLYKVKKSNIDKRGLYTSKNIKPGTKIIEYIGKVISKKETETNLKFDNKKEFKGNRINYIVVNYSFFWKNF